MRIHMKFDVNTYLMPEQQYTTSLTPAYYKLNKL